MDKLISWLIIGVFAVIIFYFMATTMQSIAEPSINLESRNFSTNNTYYAIANTPNNADLHLYYFDNTTFEIPTARYSYNATHIKVYTNGTLAYPNVTLNSIYYYSYTYQTNATIFSMDLNFVGLLVFLGVGIWCAYQLTKK